MFFSAQVILVWQWPFMTGTLIIKSTFFAHSQIWSSISPHCTGMLFSFCASISGTPYCSESIRYPQTSNDSSVLSPTQEPSMIWRLVNPFSWRYSMIPATTSGCVVPPNSAGTGATRFGLIPMRLTFEGMSVAKAHSFKSCFVISLYSIPCIWIISFLFIWYCGPFILIWFFLTFDIL